MSKLKQFLWILIALSAGSGRDLIYLKFSTEAGCRKVEKILEAQHFATRCFIPGFWRRTPVRLRV